MPPIARVGRPSTVTVELVANVSGSACAALRASVLLPSGQVLALSAGQDVESVLFPNKAIRDKMEELLPVLLCKEDEGDPLF